MPTSSIRGWEKGPLSQDHDRKKRKTTPGNQCRLLLQRLGNHPWMQKFQRLWTQSTQGLPYPVRRILAYFLIALVVISLSWLIKRIKRSIEGEHKIPLQSLDFLVAGFAKSGTTSLLKTLRTHPEIAMGEEEYCQIARPVQQDDVNLKHLNRYLYGMKKTAMIEKQSNNNPHTSFRVGVKCPDSIKNFKAIHRLTQHSPHCKIIIGMRHPVWYLQSFFNYRVMEAHLKTRPYTQTRKAQQSAEIPTLETLWYANETVIWRDISKKLTHYEMYLAQFAKTDMSFAQMRDWGFLEQPYLAIKPNSFRMFVYAMDQLQSDSSSAELRRDLQLFLNLTQPIPPFGHSNKIASNIHIYPQVVDICSVEMERIRHDVLDHAATVTVPWMLQHFLASPDVVVSDKPFLIQTIQSWAQDPCPVPNASR